MSGKNKRTCKGCRLTYNRYETKRGLNPKYCKICYATRLVKAGYISCLKRFIRTIEREYPKISDHDEWENIKKRFGNYE